MLDPDSTSPIIVILLLLVLHAIFAATKRSIISIRKSRRLQLTDEGTSSAKKIALFAENMRLTLATEQLALKLLAALIVVYSVAVYATPLAQAISINVYISACIIVIISVVFILTFGELIPKEIAEKFAEPVALWLIYPFSWLSYIAMPLAHMSASIGRLLSGRWNEPEDENSATMTEEDLLSYVDVGEEEGVLKENEKEMIYSIIDLDDTSAREVMVPRIDIIAVEKNISLEEAIEVAIKAGHSRVPVFEETIDNIVGILYVKDLLVYWHSRSRPKSIAGLERQVYFVPETKPASDLLKELQAKKVHIAIVVDEYGGTAGLVTIEDILEEIVGEIQDEHDADEFYMQYISDDEYIFSARMDLDDINNMMSINLPTDESDTLGGLIYNTLGRVPRAGDSLNGESFDAPELYFTVLAVDGRRIQSVRINRVSAQQSGKTHSDEDVVNQNPSTLLNNTHKSLSKPS